MLLPSPEHRRGETHPQRMRIRADSAHFKRIARAPALRKGFATAGLRLAEFLLAAAVAGAAAAQVAPPINRQALVSRHNPVLRQFDAQNPLTVGNGEFAFTVDVTGLQSFDKEFERTTPLGTLSQWGWHSIPSTHHWSIETFQQTEFESHGRRVGYADVPHNQRTPEINWLRSNPHRLHLGKIGLLLKKKDGSAGLASDLTDIEQTLDLWNGQLTSLFRFEGVPVFVQTVCHPERDLISTWIASPLLTNSQISLELHFPYGTGETVTADWNHPAAHETLVSSLSANAKLFERRLDRDKYFVAARWSPGAELKEQAAHRYLITRPAGTGGTDLQFTCSFSARPDARPLPDFEQTRLAASQHWNRFWCAGGAIDLSGSQDPRWSELERRIVLSQYLTAIQCAGKFPPQETGLTYNSWEGKFHLEMHWWHAAHFALWNRIELLERSLGYYQDILPRAEATARRQGYAGARWPKMTDPSGAESPSSVGPFLIWQQPHPIYYAELCYREHGDRATLEKFKDVVFQTADFMASYAAWDETTKRFVLGPPLQCSQEIFPKESTMNPTFELTYWRWGLETAQRWRERLGLGREHKWDEVLERLAKPRLGDGRYLFAETAPESYGDKKWVKDHPSVLAALGMLPPVTTGEGGKFLIEPEAMRRTLDWIWQNWNWPDTWGWDYPMVAMTAARLGEPERAVDALLLETPKNHYGINGHNYQRPGLTIYLPGNGGILYATAMMAAGWDGAPAGNAPGFPQNGKWQVRWEGLRKAP